MMKKIYTPVELEVITLLDADIITASGGISDSGDNDVDAGGSW